MIRLLTRSPNEEKSKLAIDSIATELKLSLESFLTKGTFILGPVECPFYKIDTYYRNHILIKTNQISGVKDVVKEIVLKLKLHSSVYLEIDIDPLDLV
jgi:primosomal protein N' (replication factor Y) (superfamily II helicase)